MSISERNKLFQHPALIILKKAIRREWHQQVLAATILLVTGFVLVYFFFGKNNILTVVGAIISIFGLRFWFQTIRRSKLENHRLMHLLKYQPQQIVWVYTVVTQRMPFGFEFSTNGLLYFKMLDGDEITLSLPVKQLKLVSKTLNRVLPHATFGYSDDNAQWYRADPAMLLKNEKSDNA